MCIEDSITLDARTINVEVEDDWIHSPAEDFVTTLVLESVSLKLIGQTAQECLPYASNLNKPPPPPHHPDARWRQDKVSKKKKKKKKKKKARNECSCVGDGAMGQ